MFICVYVCVCVLGGEGGAYPEFFTPRPIGSLAGLPPGGQNSNLLISLMFLLLSF